VDFLLDASRIRIYLIITAKKSILKKNKNISLT
jgi:hypothetical protein